MSHIPKLLGSKSAVKSTIGSSSLATASNKNKEPAKKPLAKADVLANINVPKLALALKKAAPTKKTTDVSKRPLQTINKTEPKPPLIERKPVKRLGAPANNDTKPKVSKPNPTKPKPAPYDYKARFHLLKEQYDNLKSVFAINKEKLIEITNENEELSQTNEKYSTELNTCKAELATLQPKVSNLEIKNKYLEENLEICETDLKTTKDELGKTLKENNEMKVTLNESTTKLQVYSNEIEELKKKVEMFIAETKDLKEELNKMDLNRRILHNEIQDMKGNIRVFCRVRPNLPDEKSRFLCNINYVDEKCLEISKAKESIGPLGRPISNRADFIFDRVFSPFASQEEVFGELAQLVRSALDGYNVCVFAYGQTGSGKTYTMDGTDSNDSLGMIPRAVDLIFSSFDQMEKLDWKFTVKVCFLEIYNETIIDLLTMKKNQHEIRMADAKKTDVFVTNLTVQTVESAEELKYYMKIAQQNRSVAATENNERSSRSHSVTKISLECMRTNKNEKYSGSLNLIDLAGSERMTSSDSSRIKETQNINKSLANLSNVILALVQKQEHIPYRNSKLTHLLMPCLGGNSKTLMLVNIAPFEDCYNESLNSLRFASIVNQCKTGNIKKNKTIVNNIKE